MWAETDLYTAEREFTSLEWAYKGAKVKLERILAPAMKEAVALRAELGEATQRLRDAGSAAGAPYVSLSNAQARSAADFGVAVSGVPRAVSKHVFVVGSEEGGELGWLTKTRITETLKKVGAYARKSVYARRAGGNFRPRWQLGVRTPSGEEWNFPVTLPRYKGRFTITGPGPVVGVRG